MKPYFSDGLVDLYLGDCREVREWLDADVLVTDPPYGVAYESGRVPSRTRMPIAGDTSTEIRDHALAEWGGATSARVWVVGSAPASRYEASAHLVEGR